jgi:tetratricopeptide (TPR) repeat protein
MLNDSIRIAEQANGHSLRRSEVSAYWSRQAVNWIEGHPWEWLNVLGAKIRNFWNAFQYDDLSVVTEFREARIILPGLKFGLIAGLALPGMLVAFGRWKTSRWVLAAILLHMTSLLTVFVTERYRLAAVPGLALFAGFTLWEIWQRATEMRVAGLAGLLSLIGCSTAFVSMPQQDETLWSLDAYNSGLKALEAGRLDDAQRKLNLAYAYSPRNAGVNFAKGNLCYANHDIAGAKHFYQSTLRLDPQHPGAWNNLGVISLEQEHWTIAAECFARAIEGNQSAGKTFYLLAEAQYHAGNLLAADTAIIRALELNPDQSEFRSLAQRISIASNIPPLP